MEEYTCKFQLQENPYELLYITKYIVDNDNGIDSKITGAMVELLVNGYLKNASESNINEVFDLLIINKDADINWKNAIEINDLLEKYF